MTRPDHLQDPKTICPRGLCCYLMRRSTHNPEGVREALREAGVGRVWLNMAEVELRGQAWLAAALQVMRDEGTTGGYPLVTPKVAFALSEGEREVLELMVAPGAVESYVSRFHNGYRQDEGRATEISAQWDAELEGLTTAELARTPAIFALAELLCGQHAEAFFRHRVLQVPPWCSKEVDLFRYSERRNQGISGQQEGRLCFLALDLKRLGREVRELTVQKALRTLSHYARGEYRRLLGPMQGDLGVCIDRLRRLPGSTPLLQTPELLDLVELMAMIHAWASTPGNRVAYLDEVVLPLLNLAEGAAMPSLSEEEVEELSELPLPAAMADQLPYHAPEGELMESFADEELRPLMEVLELEGGEQGALWLLDPGRLMTRLQALDPDKFAPRIESFMEQWWQHEQARWDGDQRAWVEHRLELDQPELTAFFNTINELQTLVEICQRNDLALGVLFYE